jgi:hypothetical protein
MYFILEVILQGSGGSVGDIIAMDTVKGEDGIILFFESAQEAEAHGKQYCCGSHSVYQLNQKVINNGETILVR